MGTITKRCKKNGGNEVKKIIKENNKGKMEVYGKNEGKQDGLGVKFETCPEKGKIIFRGKRGNVSGAKCRPLVDNFTIKPFSTVTAYFLVIYVQYSGSC
jgi:hypothetical protein